MIANRDESLAEELAAQFGSLIEWQNRGAVRRRPHQLHLGRHAPQPYETPSPKTGSAKGWSLDTIYNPERTLLIKQARERECRTITGVDTFVRQAAASSAVHGPRRPGRGDATSFAGPYPP
jgi:3-dehydroquinate dehydratase/shikimate dehydrogenase